MHDALIPRRKAVQSPCRGQIYKQDRSVTPGAPPFGIPRMFSLSAFSLLDRARPVFSFWRNQKEKMGGKRRSAACGGCSKPLSRMRHDWRPRQGPGIVPPRRCCNEPASILAGIPPPVRASTDFPPSGKKQSLPIGEPHRSPAGKNQSPLAETRSPYFPRAERIQLSSEGFS